MEWLLPPASMVLAVLATGIVLAGLRRRAVLDHPNERSSHAAPTPRGGGIAVMAVIAVVWMLLGLDRAGAALLALSAVLAAISWLDDLGGVPVWIRLLAQAASVAAGLALLPDAPVFQGLLPPVLDRLATFIIWLWFINLFNFMDGIDGLAGVETGAIGIGLAVVLVLAHGRSDSLMVMQALVVAGAAAGFLAWNWPPARIFLGDVGSIPLGFLLGWLLLGAAAQGLWAAALLLPLYHLADASITLLRRIARRERVWQAHRQHFYQQAARRFGSHATVTLWVLAADLSLMALAAAAAWRGGLALPALASGILIVGLLLCYFARGTVGAPHGG